MSIQTAVRSLVVVGVCVAFSACGSGTGPSQQIPTSPTTPTPPSGGGGGGTVTLTVPAPVSPANNEQLETLRPTLTVQNATSTAQGARTYEFQVSDRNDFTLGPSLTTSFIVSVSQPNVAEGGDGRTTFTVGSDLQPATRMYWRARVTQGATTSEWSARAEFRTKLVGYNRGGELYDPLVYSGGTTIGAIVGPHTWMAGKGLRLDTEDSFVRYRLADPLMNGGEFSVEVEGLRPNGPDHKLKIFSMSDTEGDTTDSNFQMSTMYRGVNGNPPNCIAFKAVFGSQNRIIEPNSGQRTAGIRSLNESSTYFWKATWGTGFFRLLVADGGVNGSPTYDLRLTGSGNYNPSPAYAYLGTNQSVNGSDAGTFPGAIYRHLWISDRPRPATLGNALD